MDKPGEPEDTNPSDQNPHKRKRDDTNNPSDQNPHKRHKDDTNNPSDQNPHKRHKDDTNNPSDQNPHKRHKDDTNNLSDQNPHKRHKDDTNNLSDQNPHKRHKDDTNNLSDQNPQNPHSARDANLPWLRGYRESTNPKRDSADSLDQNPEFQRRLSDLQAKQTQETRALFNKHNTENPVSWQLRKDREEIAALDNMYKIEREMLYDILINNIADHAHIHNKKDSDAYAQEARKAYIKIQKRLQKQYIFNKKNLEQIHYNQWNNIIGDLKKWKSLTHYEKLYLFEDAKDTFLPLQLEDQQHDLLQLSQKHHQEIKALRSQYEEEGKL